MTNQKLFEALERVCGFTALETDMLEIIRAVEADKMPMTEEPCCTPNGQIKRYVDCKGCDRKPMTETIECTCVEHDPYCCKIHGKCPKCTHTETIEQAAERLVREHPDFKAEGLSEYHNGRLNGIIEGATWQLSQPNPHRIFLSHVIELEDMYNSGKITRYRMVEILNEIAAGKHKERIEL